MNKPHEHYWSYRAVDHWTCPCGAVSTENPMVTWFRESGNAEFWNNVDCIECELARDCLKTPPCPGATNSTKEGEP